MPHTPPLHSPDLDLRDRIAAAWADGTLLLPLRRPDEPIALPGVPAHVLPTGLSGEAQVSFAGSGTHFEVWRVDREEGGPIAVRIPHVPASELVQPMSHEVAALISAPAGVAPSPFAFHDDPAQSPIGVPYLAVEFMPGHPLAPADWTLEHLRAHARTLAHLHTITAPGRGPIELGPDPWASATDRSPALLPEAEQLADWVRDGADGVIPRERLEPILTAMLTRVQRLDPLLTSLDGFVLAHGDLCATNITWDLDATEPTARYIDFEWAQADDPARDLAIIGGRVHTGPWYIPLDDHQVDAFVRTYAQARTDLGNAPASATDPASLRERMRLWTAFERTGMLGHVARRSRTSSEYARLLPRLQRTLEAELGVR